MTVRLDSVAGTDQVEMAPVSGFRRPILGTIDLGEPEIPRRIKLQILWRRAVSMNLLQWIGSELLSSRIKLPDIICCLLGKPDISLAVDRRSHDIVLAVGWCPGGNPTSLGIEARQRIGEHLTKPDISLLIYCWLHDSRICLAE